MRDLLKAIKAWCLRVFLPYELPDHPLHYDHEAEELRKQQEANEICEGLAELGLGLENAWMDAPYQAEYRVSSDPDTTHRI